MEIKILDTLLLFVIYIVSLFSIAGYGKMTTFFLGDNKNNNLFELFFLGLPILMILGFLNYLIIGYISYVNILVLLFGLFYYFYIFRLNNFKFASIKIPILLFLGILISKTHEDFKHHHLQSVLDLFDNNQVTPAMAQAYVPTNDTTGIKSITNTATPIINTGGDGGDGLLFNLL